MPDLLPTDPLGALAVLATLGVPLVYGLAAILAPFGAGHALFPRADRAASAALGLASVQAVLGLLPTVGTAGALGDWVRIDPVTRVMLALIAFIAFVIVRYSRAYLGGEPGEGRYVRMLMATLMAVTTVVVSDHLLVMVLAWTATSLCLHQLLTFYPERPKALVAAHKKFIVSRLADASLFGAAGLVAVHVGSLELDAIDAFAAANVGGLSLGLQVAAGLLALGAVLRTAQLPFHGWLTQVMEAPTPVSALLHAGVVNLGGFLMIRLAPLMEAVPVAQAFLVAVGTATAVVASLVMTTRTSIKMSLAWSTCAQMGFMMLQCGLGAYELALLHLVAHSFYKAYAFLSSGSTVERWRVGALSPARPTAGLPVWIAAAVAGSLGVALVGALIGADPFAEPALFALAGVVSLATTPLFVRGAQRGLGGVFAAGVAAMVVTGLYFTWHQVFGGLVPAAAEVSLGTAAPRLAIVLGGFLLLFAVEATLATRPDGRLARWLVPRLAAGLYLDELFTRATFRIWPARAPRRTTPRPVEAWEV